MPSCDAEAPESTGDTSSGRRQGPVAVRTRRCSSTKRTVASGLEALARLLGRAAAAEATGSRLTGVAPDLDRE
jgi:hypothetical protein